MEDSGVSGSMYDNIEWQSFKMWAKSKKFEQLDKGQFFLVR